MSRDLHIGIDPGKRSGGIAVLLQGRPLASLSLDKATESEIAAFLNEHRENSFAVLEKAAARSDQGRSAIFNFGRNFGFLRGVLICTGIPFEEVAPGVWQRAMKCLTGGDKKITRARAQELFPNAGITHATADASLLAEYCRRTFG